jgi:hypothetical protein
VCEGLKEVLGEWKRAHETRERSLGLGEIKLTLALRGRRSRRVKVTVAS